MSDWRESVVPIIHHSKIKVPYTWSVGDTGSKFLRALRDDKKILANKCPTTGKIFCPPKLNSPYSLQPITEWLELAGTGTVKAFTQRHYESRAIAPDAPKITALIELDGATQALPHFLGEVDFAKIKIGMRVQAVFREDPTGHILDIKYFRPVGV
ncbi:MAG: OB-fold domain-containing protein [Spirochaetes bacterium]|nr:OB-fold domain-containing protein [Spirochaetota bacterium]